MQSFTAVNKASLKTFLTTNGKKAYFVAYNPVTAGGSGPETAATGAGYTQYYREATATWVEVIYTK